MKALRNICILVLAAGLVLGSAGGVFADSSAPSRDADGDVQDQWRVFYGSVIAVNNGNVTIDTKHSGDVVVTLNDTTRFKVLGEAGWVKLDKFKVALGGSLSELQGDRVAVLAINVSKTSAGAFAGEAVLFVVMQRHEVLRNHHRTGIVTEFSLDSRGNGNITIKDIHGASHRFTIIGNETSYNPQDKRPKNGDFVTVVTKGEPKPQSMAKMIVVHPSIPKGWPTPTPTPNHRGTGILEGTVTIGPICPVERPGVPCPVPCEAYQARKILIYDENGTKLLQQVNINCDGHYLVELKAGEYTVDVTHAGIGHVTNVPKKIEIKSGKTIELNIDIDTGIR
jgi:hypothetical protein